MELEIAPPALQLSRTARPPRMSVILELGHCSTQSACLKRARTGNPAASLDDFVGRGQQRRRNGEAEGFGGLEVDDQLETRRLLDRQIAGLCAFQDLVDVADRAAEIIEEIRSIREKQALGNLFGVSRNCRHLMRLDRCAHARPLIVHWRPNYTCAIETVTGNG
jgi:hypothetical protein